MRTKTFIAYLSHGSLVQEPTDLDYRLNKWIDHMKANTVNFKVCDIKINLMSDKYETTPYYHLIYTVFYDAELPRENYD